MSILFNKPRNAETAEIRSRIFNVLPAASFQIEKLFGLLDIEYSDLTPTACVECRDTPKLLLNRQFVEEYCKDDGDLLLLILHELYHVILGHTRLFPRVDQIDNIAFDAVINSILAHTVGRSVGVGLFTKTNRWRDFPARLLRPPPGWPNCTKKSLKKLPEQQANVIHLLYNQTNESVTYHDLYSLLRKALGKDVEATQSNGRPKGKQSNAQKKRSQLTEQSLPSQGEPSKGLQNTQRPAGFKGMLLGNHEKSPESGALLTKTIQRIAHDWPSPKIQISGRSGGRDAELFGLRSTLKPGAAFIKAFRQVLHCCGVSSSRGPATYRSRLTLAEFVRESVLPDQRDRRVIALKSITGHAPLIYRTPDLQIRKRPTRVPTVHVYLDISASMNSVIPYITAACREPFRRGELKMFAFSTIVREVKGPDLTKAKIENTFGTDINPVIEHFRSLPIRLRPKVLLIVTDGYVGSVRKDLLPHLTKTRTVAALTNPAYELDVKPWISELHRLPKP